MTALLLFLSLLAAAVLAFAAVDAWRFLGTWGGRIHIGRWHNRHDWRHALAARALRWTKRTPTVPKKDQSRLVLWDMLRGTYADSSIQGWQLAGLVLGLAAHAAAQNDAALSEYLRRLARSRAPEKQNKGASIDGMLLEYALLAADPEHAPARAERVAESLVARLTPAGTLPYRPWQASVRYVDTIGLACPLAAAAAALTGREELWKLALRQIEEYDIARLPASSFPAHGYEMERGYPLGLYDWSRGLGWYALGLCEVYRHMAEAERPEAANVAARIAAFAGELLPLQKKTGGFGWMVARPESVFESSGTALLGQLMLTAWRIEGDARFLDAARAAEKALMKVTRRNGTLDMCQGDTKGIGMYSDVWNIMPFAQGMALRLTVELDREAKTA